METAINLRVIRTTHRTSPHKPSVVFLFAQLHSQVAAESLEAAQSPSSTSQPGDHNHDDNLPSRNSSNLPLK